jgi:hypothetical protein
MKINILGCSERHRKPAICHYLSDQRHGCHRCRLPGFLRHARAGGGIPPRPADPRSRRPHRKPGVVRRKRVDAFSGLPNSLRKPGDTLHGSRSILNGEVWADFVIMSERMLPFLRLQVLQPEVPITIEGLTITPVAVNHSVPTAGYIVRDDDTSVIFGADSGPTRRLWELTGETLGLRAVSATAKTVLVHDCQRRERREDKH